MKILSLALLLLIFQQTAFAASLFGVQLQNSTIDQLRTAAKQAGATVIQQSDASRPYDIFDSKAVFPGSSRLYIGFLEAGRQTVFVEYEFVGIKRPDILKILRNKYGKPVVRNAKYLSDQSYRWKLGGTNIILWSDWKNYRTRISYLVTEAMRDFAAKNAETTARGERVNTENY